MMKWGYLNRPQLNNEHGMTLVLVLLVLTVLSILGMGLLGVVMNNAQMSSGERDYQSTYYIAEAGITKRFQEVKSEVQDAYESTSSESDFYRELESAMLIETSLDTFEAAFGEQPKADMKVEKLNQSNPRQYRMTSEGMIDNRSRTVERTFEVGWAPKRQFSVPEHMSVFTETTIDLSGGATITGNLGTNSAAARSIRLDGGARINDGDIYVPEGSERDAVDAPDWMDVPPTIAMGSPSELKLPPFPVYPNYEPLPDQRWNDYHVIEDGNLKIDSWKSNGYTLNLERNASLSEIILTSNRKLTIDTGNNDKAIVVDDLNVQNGHINLAGSGKLTVYVNGEINMGAGSDINNGGNIEDLQIYLKSSQMSNSLNLSGSQKIFGSLYAEDADITLSGGGGFQGHIFTGGSNFTINGGARAYASLLFAPHADFSISGGGSVDGSVIAHQFSASGGARVKYEEEDMDIPFDPGGGSTEPEELIDAEPIREAP
ncbi:PilX N-terminal domain-containing pilus assembly protein [Thalassobacillus sp. CUG 92003]|uniref:DUF7305 domain-containing protein n=1 Tax=Thalassobacillus sp. CUG 92003 TaxID=2736641 RepID=UPI0015E7D248|nr:PilX N-terminal domain-containing pilus assembly protein [Thalassobacillus sp. CUG 92003]